MQLNITTKTKNISDSSNFQPSKNKTKQKQKIKNFKHTLAFTGNFAEKLNALMFQMRHVKELN